MLLASWLGDQFGMGIIWMMIFIAVAIQLGKKFGNANPEVKEAAKKAASAKAIQELAGHQDLATTQRYMHLSPSAIDAAIRLLDEPVPLFARGDILETADPAKLNANG